MNICMRRTLRTDSLPMIDFRYLGRTQSALTYDCQRCRTAFPDCETVNVSKRSRLSITEFIASSNESPSKAAITFPAAPSSPSSLTVPLNVTPFLASNATRSVSWPTSQSTSTCSIHRRTSG